MTPLSKTIRALHSAKCVLYILKANICDEDADFRRECLLPKIKAILPEIEEALRPKEPSHTETQIKEDEPDSIVDKWLMDGVKTQSALDALYFAIANERKDGTYSSQLESAMQEARKYLSHE